MTDSNSNNKVGVHLLRHDLRIKDNEALLSLCQQCQHVYLLYCHQNSWMEPNEFGHKHLGQHRQIFVDEALVDVAEKAQAANIIPVFIKSEGIEDITKFVRLVDAGYLSYELHFGFNEQQQIAKVKASLPNLQFIEGQSNYLLNLNNLPFEMSDMPNVFSPFRRKIEKRLDVRMPSELAIESTTLQQPKAIDFSETFTLYEPSTKHSDNGYIGGENSAYKRLNDYFFDTDGIAVYKETRNGLDGWDFSSRLSAFLAHGCISPAEIYRLLGEYETHRVKNDSTYWLFFELLWREFFHYQSNKHQAKLFAFGGIQEKPPLSQHNTEKFDSWVNGNTGYKIVDACMKQLATTGFMSNRGRQLVASCFVHELGLDWRWGASYFEQELIDFDVASNYGNWQYLAGVGSDPRGHRQFNLAKQTSTYDPQYKFINSWL